MNKYKVLGVVLMLSIILAIGSAWKLGETSMSYIISGTPQFLSFLALLCLVLFGSLSALTLDKIK